MKTASIWAVVTLKLTSHNNSYFVGWLHMIAIHIHDDEWKNPWCFELLFQVRLLLCLPHSTSSFFSWSVFSHSRPWHTQTETLHVSLKAFPFPLLLLKATKHQLSWPAITFSPLSVSHLSTCCTPSSPSLCFLQLTDILIFPLLYLSCLHLHLCYSHFHSGRLSCFLNLARATPPCSMLLS